MIKRDVDVAVVGGGAAGLASAIKAKEEGAAKVLVIDRNEEPGGILPQCIHTGFGLQYFRENLTGPEYVSRFIRRARNLGVEFKLETMVLRLTPGKQLTAVNGTDGLVAVQAKAVVLAMGCRETPRGGLSIPGTRPAGIFTAGTAQRIMDIEGYAPGRRIVVLGSGDVGLIMARRFAMEGAHVEAVVERYAYPGGLSRNVVQCLEDFEIPLLLEHTVTSIHGDDRIEAITVSRVDDRQIPVPGSERMIKCDTLVLSVGMIPENELSEGAGVTLDPATRGPLVDERTETSTPGVFACGNVVHVHDLVDHVTQAGELAGENAAKYALGRLPPLERKTTILAGGNVRYVVPHFISCETPVDLYFRVEAPMQNVQILFGNLTEKRRVVRPPETVVFKLTKRKIEKLDKGDKLVLGIARGPGNE
ncbi:FAD-dependent oxidoreductase [Candidatus Bathyarchaeota archaeon]|nr:FAD-dependent oxidoreductase [Candidatus Bathyarchaeota archaeon]